MFCIPCKTVIWRDRWLYCSLDGEKGLERIEVGVNSSFVALIATESVSIAVPWLLLPPEVGVNRHYLTNVLESQIKFLICLESKAGSGSTSLVPRPRPKNRKRGLVYSASVHFLSIMTSQNFEEPIRLQNETTRNVIPSHAHKAKSADYAIW